MAANQKLTAILRGRTATRVDWSGATAAVQFDDGSTMSVQTGSGAAANPVGTLGQVSGVRQRDLTLNLDFEGGTTLTLRTAEMTSSVLVRASDHSLEYAD
jgi:hypothetical protein